MSEEQELKKEPYFGELYSALEKNLKTRFPKANIEGEFSSQDKSLKKKPSIYIECVDIDPSDKQPSDKNQMDFDTRWEIRHTVRKSKLSRIVARNAALRIAQSVRKDKLAKCVIKVTYMGSTDDGFDNSADLESWVNDFEIKIRVGEEHWEKWESYSENVFDNENYPMPKKESCEIEGKVVTKGFKKDDA